jgi:hypothetical protein
VQPLVDEMISCVDAAVSAFPLHCRCTDVYPDIGIGLLWLVGVGIAAGDGHLQ